MSEIVTRLVLILAASYTGSVGYGDVFECQVKSVLAGSMSDAAIRLTILAGDKKNARFISSHLRPAEIEVGFKMVRKDEPYSTAPISGFVDKSRVSWEIEFVQEVKK